MPPADPRLRLVAAVLAVVAVSQLRTLPVAAAVLPLAVLLVVFSRPDRRLWRRMLHVEGFMVLLFLTLPFTVAGPAVATFGPLAVSSTGLARAALIALKVSACVLLLAALLGGLDPARLGATLHALYVPERFSRLFVMTARYVSLIRDEVRRLTDSMRARGFRPRSTRHTWRSYGNLVGMILVRALDRAERVEEAMLCRGYAGRFPYAALSAPQHRDWIAFAVISGTGLLALVVDRL
ncbi:cobalt ECF transporter T component CbiQ [Pseudoxanthobacter sp.]|uniref:cobalt ECF transporter T component CbiQ n=1 Tax=Pseudoxanthobacter sp. TaxID=1925742 RepID=UPI002FE2E791